MQGFWKLCRINTTHF